MNLLGNCDLSCVKRCVVGAVEKDGKPISCRIFGEVFVGDGGMLLQPVVDGESLNCGSDSSVHLSPRFLQIGSREWIRKFPIGITEIGLIEFRILTLTDSEDRQHAVVHG